MKFADVSEEQVASCRFYSNGLQPRVLEDILTEPLEPRTASGPRTHEDSSPNWGAGMPETSSVISLAGQNHINNW
jgi:hypothetical protein